MSFSPAPSRPVILCDNQPLTRDAVASYLSDRLILPASEKTRLVALLDKHPNGLVISDYALFDFKGPENVLILLRRFPQSSWIFLSSDFREPFLRLLGAETQASFLTKSCSRQELMEAVHAAEEGARHVCDAVAEQLRSGFAATTADQLTASETEVLSWLARGLSSREIAEQRHTSIHTVITQKKNIFRKLGVSTAYEATRHALRAGLVNPVEYYI
ncbi:MAG: DNA-binding response regulator [Alloprevotella sp.]